MSGRRSRNKGAVAEREVAAIIKDRLGFDCHRTPLSGGMQWKGDVQGLPGYHVEIKRAETLAIPRWWEQAISDAPDGCDPVLIFRPSRQPWRVVLTLDHFLDLLEVRYASDATERERGDRAAMAAEADHDPAESAGCSCADPYYCDRVCS